MGVLQDSFVTNSFFKHRFMLQCAVVFDSYWRRKNDFSQSLWVCFLPYQQFGQTYSLKAEALEFSSVQSLSPVWLFATPWTAARQASLSITNSWNLLKFMSVESAMPFNYLILCHPLLFLPCLSQHQGPFQWVRNSASQQQKKLLKPDIHRICNMERKEGRWWLLVTRVFDRHA